MLVGDTINAIDVGYDEIKFACADGKIFKMYHVQDCCESVTVDDITGDLEDIWEEKFCFDLCGFIVTAFKSPNWNYNNLKKLLESECYSEEELKFIKMLFKEDE